MNYIQLPPHGIAYTITAQQMNSTIFELLQKHIRTLVLNDGSYAFHDESILQVIDILRDDFDCTLVKSVKYYPIYSGTIYKLACFPIGQEKQSHYEKLRSGLQKYGISIANIVSGTKLEQYVTSVHIVSSIVSFEQYKELVENHIKQFKNVMDELYINELQIQGRSICIRDDIFEKSYSDFIKRT